MSRVCRAFAAPACICCEGIQYRKSLLIHEYIAPFAPTANTYLKTRPGNPIDGLKDRMASSWCIELTLMLSQIWDRGIHSMICC